MLVVLMRMFLFFSCNMTMRGKEWQKSMGAKETIAEA